MRMEKHVTLIAALNIGFGAMGILAAGIVFVAVAGGGLLSGDAEAIAITSIVGLAISFFLTLVSVPGIIGGLGLLMHKPWARVLVIVISIFGLFNIPLGTALAIYTLWVLLNDETTELFASA